MKDNNEQDIILGDDEKLISIFDQSWEYIRHSQDMFWQSFTALFTIIIAITLFSWNSEVNIQFIGISSSLILSLMGYFFSNRIIVILREHFVLINRIRKKLGVDKISELISPRWKKYSEQDFGVLKIEMIYVFIATQLYIGIFSLMAAGLTYLLSYSYIHQIRIIFGIGIWILSVAILELCGLKYVYKQKKKS